MSGRILKWAGLVLFLATIGVMGRYFYRVGWDQADKAASVLGAFSGVVGLALTLYGMFASRATPTPTSAEDTVSAAKKALASAVSKQWRTEAMIRSLDDPEPIPVSWHLIDDAGLMDHPRLISEHLLTFTGSSDQIPKLARAFQELARRRLVITGGPGTGKTTLAIQLLLELLSSGVDTADPVPVLLPVNGWDTAAHPRLHDWLAARLTVDYPALNAAEFGTEAARALVTHGHILPILDGLDEIPEPARVAVISALNRWLAKEDPFILTSRTTEFTAAIEQAGDVLTAAAVIAPAIVTPADAETYLRTSLPPVPRHDWTPIWAALHDHSHLGLSRLAETALGLWLIRTVYITPAADPAPLTGPAAQQAGTLRAHLFDHLIAAVIDSRPPSHDPAEHFRPRVRWNPDHARDHLAYLSRLLHDHSTYDLAWWQLAQHATPPDKQRRIARRTKLALGLAFGLMFGLTLNLMNALALGLLFGLGGRITGGKPNKRFTRRPGHANSHPSEQRVGLIKHLRDGFTGGLAVGLAVWLAGGLTIGLAFGLAGGLTIRPAGGLTPGFEGRFGNEIAGRLISGLGNGIAGGLIGWLAVRKMNKWFTEGPGYANLHLSGRKIRLIQHLRDGLAGGFTFGLTFWLMGGLMAGLAVGLTFGLMGGLMGGLMVGLAVGLAGGLTIGLTFGLAGGLIKWAEEPAAFTAATTPLTSWKADRALTLLRVIPFGLVGGPAGGLVFMFVGGLIGSTDGFMVALAVGLISGLAVGLAAGDHHAWSAYTITVLRLTRKERIPRNLMAFLDDAHRLGLLRTVGPIYQFRHAELQDHLAALPPPSSNPINTTTTPRSTKNAI